MINDFGRLPINQTNFAANHSSEAIYVNGDVQNEPRISELQISESHLSEQKMSESQLGEHNMTSSNFISHKINNKGKFVIRIIHKS